MAKVIYTLKITLPRTVNTHRVREEGTAPVHDVLRHNVRRTVDVLPLLELDPGNGPHPPQGPRRLSRQRDRTDFGQYDGPAPVVPLRGAHRPLPLRRGDGGRGEANHCLRHAAEAGGEESTPLCRRFPRDGGVALAAVGCDQELLRLHHLRLGADGAGGDTGDGHDFLNVDPADCSERDDFAD